METFKIVALVSVSCLIGLMVGLMVGFQEVQRDLQEIQVQLQELQDEQKLRTEAMAAARPIAESGEDSLGVSLMYGGGQAMEVVITLPQSLQPSVDQEMNIQFQIQGTEFGDLDANRAILAGTWANQYFWEGRTGLIEYTIIPLPSEGLEGLSLEPITVSIYIPA